MDGFSSRRLPNVRVFSPTSAPRKRPKNTPRPSSRLDAPAPQVEVQMNFVDFGEIGPY